MKLYPSLLAVFDKTPAPEALVAAALAAQAAGADALHLDFMAPPFLNRTTFDPEIVGQLRAAGVTLPLDTHLMTGPDWLGPILAQRPESLTIHPKSFENLAAVQAALERIAGQGVQAGLALDHDEAVAPLASLLQHPACRQVTLLTVVAGAGGQSLQPQLLEKVKKIHEINEKIEIVIDGGVNTHTWTLVQATGAAAAVAGSAVFGAHNLADAVNSLKNMNP